jgi:hypothetical protein
MKLYCKPVKLEATLVDVRKIHQRIGNQQEVQLDQKFYDKLRYWAGLPEEQVEAVASIVPKYQLLKIASYIGTNSLQLNLDNLLDILYLRMDKDVFGRLFNVWQDCFEDAAIKKLLSGTVNGKRSIVDEFLNNSQMTVAQLRQWLQEPAVVVAVGKTVKMRRQGGKSFSEALKEFSIYEQSLLGKRCAQEFYTFCDRMDYLACKDIDLYNILKTYKGKTVHNFLRNILNECHITDFQKFWWCGTYIRDYYTSTPDTQKFDDFFLNYSSGQIDKYKKWLSYIAVFDFFGQDRNDARLLFWQKYLPYTTDIPYMVGYSECFIMRFEYYTVLEFTEKTQGPLYVYENQDFEKRIKPQTVSCTNNELRSNLYHSLNINRIVHTPDVWEKKTARYLTSHRIVH